MKEIQTGNCGSWIGSPDRDGRAPDREHGWPRMIPLGQAAPILRWLHDRIRAGELSSEDLPAAYVRRRYRVPEDAPVISRINQVIAENRARWRRS